MNYKEIAEQTTERLNLENPDVDIEAVIKTAFQIFVDQKMEEVQDRIDQFEGKRFVDFGKLKLLEEMQE